MRRTFVLVSVVAASLACHPPALLRAQGAEQSVDAQKRERCRLAAQVVATGNPAPHDAWALDEIAACGVDGGAALGRVVRATRHSTDVVLLDKLTRTARQLRDGELYAASLDVAGDPTASTAARAFAFRTLVAAAKPNVWFDDYAALIHPAVAGVETCEFSTEAHADRANGSPVPADASSQVAAIARRVAAEASAPTELRALARCVEMTAGH
jgi:hypothetical protein